MFFDKLKNNFVGNKDLTQEKIQEKIKNANYSFSYTKGIITSINKNYRTITLVDDYIVIDDNGNLEFNNNKELINKLWKIIDSFSNVIISSAEKTKTIEKEKCNRTENIILRLQNNEYYWNGRVADNELNTLFNNISNEFLRIYNANTQISKNLNEKQIK